MKSWGASGGGSAGFYTQAEAGPCSLMGSERGLEPMGVCGGVPLQRRLPGGQDAAGA